MATHSDTRRKNGVFGAFPLRVGQTPVPLFLRRFRAVRSKPDRYFVSGGARRPQQAAFVGGGAFITVH